MTHEENVSRTAASARAGQQAWTKPTLRRLHAGSAEVGANPQNFEGAFARGQS